MIPLPQGDTEVPGRRNGRMGMYCTYMRGSTSAVRILTICAGSVHSTRVRWRATPFSTGRFCSSRQTRHVPCETAQVHLEALHMTPGPRARWPTGTPLVLVADGLPFPSMTVTASLCGPVASGMMTVRAPLATLDTSFMIRASRMGPARHGQPRCRITERNHMAGAGGLTCATMTGGTHVLPGPQHEKPR